MIHDNQHFCKDWEGKNNKTLIIESYQVFMGDIAMKYYFL